MNSSVFKYHTRLIQSTNAVWGVGSFVFWEEFTGSCFKPYPFTYCKVIHLVWTYKCEWTTMFSHQTLAAERFKVKYCNKGSSQTTGETLNCCWKYVWMRNLVINQSDKWKYNLIFVCIPHIHTHTFFPSSNPLLNSCRSPIDLDKNLLCNSKPSKFT